MRLKLIIKRYKYIKYSLDDIDLDSCIEEAAEKTISHLNPDKSAAGSFASICGTFMGGQHPDTGATFIIIEPENKFKKWLP